MLSLKKGISSLFCPLTFGGVKQIFDFFDELFDVVAGSFQLFFVRMKRIPEIG